MNFVGILDENEFYSDHYLADALDGDSYGRWTRMESGASRYGNSVQAGTPI